jgi:hypothetical protein
MDSNRIREIHLETAYPSSRSVYQALLQVWNECEQDETKIDKHVAINFAQHLLKDFCTIEVTQETLNNFLNKK